MVEQFELERFEWRAPDRLEISGKFHGLQEPPADTPVLVVSGDGEAHRLDAVPDIGTGRPEDGKAWSAQFLWDETPIGVEAAALELGPDLMIELPAPGAKETLLRPRFIDVRRAQRAAAAAALDDESPQAEAAPAAGGDVALQADLVAAEEQVQELRAALERTEAELDRARADVEAERKGRAADAQRFRAGLARVRASAEQALAGAQAEAQQLGEQLGNASTALEESEAARAELSRKLEAADAARAELESETHTLREQVAAGDDLRGRMSTIADVGAGEMRADAQRLLERLTRLVDVLDGGK
jgi:hypothetical protein